MLSATILPSIQNRLTLYIFSDSHCTARRAGRVAGDLYQGGGSQTTNGRRFEDRRTQLCSPQRLRRRNQVARKSLGIGTQEQRSLVFCLGRAYYTRSRIPKAKKAFLIVLDLDPHHAKAENNLGLIFESEAKPEEAMQAYRKATEWQEQSAHPSEQPHLNLGLNWLPATLCAISSGVRPCCVLES